MRKTHEGAAAYEHSLDHAVEFFSKAGSLFEGKRKKSFYGEGSEETALALFQKTWIVDPVISFKLLLWLRDCRGGSGNRSGARSCLKWLALHDPDWIKVNIGWFPLIGRWDDLRTLFGTPVETEAVGLWAEALMKTDVLAAKWADRSDKPLRRALGMTERAMRKRLAEVRKMHIVEFKMCENQWGEINYEHIPSVAMARYTKAFGRHDETRFNLYKEALKKGEAKIHAGVLFPHDCVRTVRDGDADIGDAQFEALPNFMSTDSRVIVICDTSGSMGDEVSGSIKRVDISQALALYCSAKIPKSNPFHKKFIGFSTEGKFQDWNGMKFSEPILAYCNMGYDVDRRKKMIFDGAVGSTHIDKALDLILKTAKFFSLKDDQMPNMLLIVSDMQFHDGSETADKNKSEVEKCIDKWVEAGYSVPQIVYWNLAGYAGQPITSKHNNVALVSGFSPAILKAVFEAEDLTPKGVMIKALEKYNIEVPK
jgi:hypothetical protein